MKEQHDPRIIRYPNTGVIILPNGTMHCYQRNPANCNRFVLFDSTKTGNLMTPEIANQDF